MNALIVDDQTLNISGMLTGIRWKELGIDNVFTAGSAEEARKVFQNTEIDILITDIEMPYENGISLVKWVRERGYKTECIFLTSHAEFDYAREAVSLGSFDYILQPARYEAIEEVIKRVYLKVIKERNTNRLQSLKDYEEQLTDDTADHYLERLLAAQNEGEEAERTEDSVQAILKLKGADEYQDLTVTLALQKLLHWRKREWEHNLERASVLNVLQELIDTDRCKVIRLKVKNDLFAVLIPGERNACDPQTLIQKLEQYLNFEESYLDFNSAFYFYGEVEPSFLADGIRYAGVAMSQNIMCESKVFVRSEKEEEKKNCYDKSNLFHTKRWGEMLLSGKGQKIEQELRDYFERDAMYCGNSAENAMLLKKLHQRFASVTYDVMTAKNMDYGSFFDENYSLQDFINCYDTYEHLVQAVNYVVRRLKDIESERETGGSEESQIEQVITYVRNNLDKRITYKDVAEFVHLNEDYLARIFKKKTGYALKEYINNEKVHVAKELLSTTNMSVSVIALKSGFGNFSHFSQTFKKVTGTSPSEYRDRNKK